MINFIKKVFEKKRPVSKTDIDFGEIVFIEDVSKKSEPYWEMQNYWNITEHKARIQCVGIPGNVDGPYEYARKFLTTNKEELEDIWALCREELDKTIRDYYPKHIGCHPKEIFTLCNINMDSEQEWEVCFEADSEFKWVYLGLQLKDNEIISGTLDT
jgi:hypothetical protein